jgi:hypothetical protein
VAEVYNGKLLFQKRGMPDVWLRFEASFRLSQVVISFVGLGRDVWVLKLSFCGESRITTTEKNPF